jgi:hypothetical protein
MRFSERLVSDLAHAFGGVSQIPVRDYPHAIAGQIRNCGPTVTLLEQDHGRFRHLPYPERDAAEERAFYAALRGVIEYLEDEHELPVGELLLADAERAKWGIG